jgi:antitoxin VapB
MKTLNVKDPEAHQLASQIARLTGKSLTQVVTEALRDRLDKLERSKRKASLEELNEIALSISRNIKRPYEDHATLLYDENGLPK